MSGTREKRPAVMRAQLSQRLQAASDSRCAPSMHMAAIALQCHTACMPRMAVGPWQDRLSQASSCCASAGPLVPACTAHVLHCMASCFSLPTSGQCRIARCPGGPHWTGTRLHSRSRQSIEGTTAAKARVTMAAVSPGTSRLSSRRRAQNTQLLQKVNPIRPARLAGIGQVPH